MLRSAPAALSDEEEAVEEQLCEDIQDALERGDTTFNFSHNHEIRRFPEDISILRPNLTVLHIDNCYQLEHIPGAIGNLTGLTWLNLTYNKLSHLPPEIGKLRNLERLHVNNNLLVELPHELWNLKRLQELQCDTNRIRALPSGVLEMGELRELHCHNNPLLVPEDVADEALMEERAPKPPPVGDCDQSRARFEKCFTYVSFHCLCGVEQVPVVHYLSTIECLQHKKQMCEARIREEQQEKVEREKRLRALREMEHKKGRD
eukprot:TRINITY_DN21422_c0_g1_i1.p1 TRINITY_DN21422_c0_g1~~TRINITY_DN21422_c0_g1_i1.p1  ORF type:complete len:261 (+),score=85.64 TRINITY_DN21422_c0_g1_i1:83-865(+)